MPRKEEFLRNPIPLEDLRLGSLGAFEFASSELISRRLNLRGLGLSRSSAKDAMDVRLLDDPTQNMRLGILVCPLKGMIFVLISWYQVALFGLTKGYESTLPVVS